ncbi:MAG: GspE/PulE family protein, partial [Planctomycetota bacterium]
MDEKQQIVKNEAGLLFGEWLVKNSHITHEDLCEALSEQHQQGGRLGEVLLRLKMLDSDFIAYALAEYLHLEYVQLDSLADVDVNIAKLIPEKIAKRFCLVAIKHDEEGRLVVAMADPLNIIAIDTVTLKSKQKVKVVISSAKNIRDVSDAVYHGSHVAEQKLRDLVELELNAEEEVDYNNGLMETDIRSEEEAATQAPVIRFVNLLLSQAVKRKASDVHIEPQEKSMILRMRIDGLLRETVAPPHRLHSAVITRIKILSGMNIAERRLPQDGRLKIRAPGRDIDVRVSGLPTIYGEKIVMRILDKKAVTHDLDHLGFTPEFLHEFKRVLRQPYGIVVVTGPTGSGKTTTL